MTMRSIGVLWFGLLVGLAPSARAQGRADAVALARLQAASDSSAKPQPSWSATGAVVGGITGGAVFAVAFYQFSHRDGAVNSTTGNLGGTLVGFALGAASGALLGAFVGSLFPKHENR
jgi:MFS family permease